MISNIHPVLDKGGLFRCTVDLSHHIFKTCLSDACASFKVSYESNLILSNLYRYIQNFDDM